MKQLTSTFWDKYFVVYDTLNQLLPYKYLISDLITELDLKKGESVIDVGVGTGNVSIRIAAAGAVPTGIDISPSGIKICQEKIPQCNFIVGNLMEPLPFVDCSFDKAVSNNVIYAIPPSERKLVANELFRVLRPGGRIVIANISPGFSPARIYLAHIREELRLSGILGTFGKILKFISPTIKIFYYNFLIQRSALKGSYSYLSEDDQYQFLKQAGFINISPGKRVYANAGVLTVAQKPNESN
jgi:ubiquinone/menaquinone biosynthesis C-methylase UbiE